MQHARRLRDLRGENQTLLEADLQGWAGVRPRWSAKGDCFVNLLAFFAHPDDETILAGGTLALLAKNGVHVHYLCATRGEGGETGEPPLCSMDELGQVREKEMVCAVGALGGRSLTFLGYTDPHIGADNQLHAYTEDLTFLAGQIAASVRQFQVDALVSHGSNGEYGHPAHLVTYQASLAAVLSFERHTPAFYTIAAAYPDHPLPILANQADLADIVIDIESVFENKVKAALCHQTQHALFVRRASQEAGRKLSIPEVLLKKESLHRVRPAEISNRKDPLLNLLAPWAVDFTHDR